VNVELAVARSVVSRVVILGPPVLAVFGITRGWDGLVGAAIGIAVVVGNFLLSGFMLSRAARISPGFYQGAALFGFLGRLVLITLGLLGVAALFEIDRLAVGISAIVTYLGLITWEAAVYAKGREEEEITWTA